MAQKSTVYLVIFTSCWSYLSGLEKYRVLSNYWVSLPKPVSGFEREEPFDKRLKNRFLTRHRCLTNPVFSTGSWKRSFLTRHR